MSDEVRLHSRLLLRRTHCLTEDVALVGFKNLLVAQGQHQAISLHLGLVSLVLPRNAVLLVTSVLERLDVAALSDS